MKKKSRSKIISDIVNVVTIAFIVEAFLCAIIAVRKYAREDCFDRIEETTVQMNAMFNRSVERNRDALSVFATILGTNSENPDSILSIYMENFCKTHNFNAVSIKRANGSSIYYGDYPELGRTLSDFEHELSRLPYISDVFSKGNTASEKYIYQAVPIYRNDVPVGILYGYISLDRLPAFIVSAAYDGNCQINIVDGKSGDVIMNSGNDVLGNLYDGILSQSEPRKSYSFDEMCGNIRLGEDGYFVYRPERLSEWYYTYYMPVGINNWSIQLTINESTALEGFNRVNLTVVVLFICVLILMFAHVIALMSQTAYTKKKDKSRLDRSRYVNLIQRSLLRAQSDPDYVEQTLMHIAEEMKAETVLLLTFTDKMINRSYYWPSKDKPQAMELIGRNIRDDFPMIYDRISVGENVIFFSDESEIVLADSEKMLFKAVDARNIILVPIMDDRGHLKGAICAVNVDAGVRSSELLDCVTYDLFMAITNIENHALIKSMGEMDLLTDTKNRNSYESELIKLSDCDADSLSCVFIDVNGLHEMNNTRGHKAGDAMLCSVASILKKTFGSKYTYRIGGDEFVSFVSNMSEEEIDAKRKYIIKDLESRGYYISVGYDRINKNENGRFDVDKIVSEAEKSMYNEKKKYYSGIPMRNERNNE